MFIIGKDLYFVLFLAILLFCFLGVFREIFFLIFEIYTLYLKLKFFQLENDFYISKKWMNFAFRTFHISCKFFEKSKSIYDY